MRVKGFLMLFVLGLFLLSMTSYAADVVCGTTMYTKVETPHPYNKATTDTLVWSHTFNKSGAGWLNVHFSDLQLNNSDYIVMYDMYGFEVERITGKELVNPGTCRFKLLSKEAGKVEFWGPMVDGDELRVELHRGSNKGAGWGFKIDQVGVGYAPLEMYDNELDRDIKSICGTDDKVNIKCATATQQTKGLAVGRMYFQSAGSWYVCTGFLVSSCSSHFLTNEHCITDQTGVNSLQVRFKYRYTTCSGTTVDSYTTVYGSTYVKDSTTYDYCLLTLQGAPQSTYGYLQLLNRAPVVNESIYIIQHPGGTVQKIGTGTVYNITANSNKDLGYMIDTEGGSSGSPVLASDNKVIGLHHYGGCPNSAVKMNLIYNAIKGYLCQ